MSQSLIDRLLPMIEERGHVDIVYGGERFGTQAEFATELRTLLAERDDLRSRLADAMKYTYTTPTPPRPARQYKGVVYRENAWETPDGKRYEMASGVVWNKAVTLSLTDLDIPALLALRDDPEYPCETLEDVIHAWSNAGPLLSNYRIDDLCYRLRAHLATHPQPVSVPYTFVGGTGETLEWVLADWANATRDGVHSVELSDLEHRLRAWLATQPQAITPEQAVGVLVEKGGYVVKEVVRIETKRGGYKYPERYPARIMILPADMEPTP